MNYFTGLAAWWGALISTILLVWDVFKWVHTGPIINVTVLPNMEVIGDIPNINNTKNFISVEAVNNGNRGATITHLVIFFYKSYKCYLLKKATKSFIAIPAFSPQLPYLLNPGGRWIGGIVQQGDFEEMSQKGYLYCGIIHSGSKKPVLQRVAIRKNVKTTT